MIETKRNNNEFKNMLVHAADYNLWIINHAFLTTTMLIDSINHSINSFLYVEFKHFIFFFVLLCFHQYIFFWLNMHCRLYILAWFSSQIYNIKQSYWVEWLLGFSSTFWKLLFYVTIQICVCFKKLLFYFFLDKIYVASKIKNSQYLWVKLHIILKYPPNM